jgi:hypothetical protein
MPVAVDTHRKRLRSGGFAPMGAILAGPQIEMGEY